jgi:hypothetical protein
MIVLIFLHDMFVKEITLFLAAKAPRKMVFVSRYARNNINVFLASLAPWRL